MKILIILMTFIVSGVSIANENNIVLEKYIKLFNTLDVVMISGAAPYYYENREQQKERDIQLSHVFLKLEEIESTRGLTLEEYEYAFTYMFGSFTLEELLTNSSVVRSPRGWGEPIIEVPKKLSQEVAFKLDSSLYGGENLLKTIVAIITR